MEKTQANDGSFTGGLVFSAVAVVFIFFSLIFSVISAATGFSAQAEDGTVNSAFVYVSYLIMPAATAIAVPILLKLRKVKFSGLVPVARPSADSAKWCGAAVLLAFGMLFTLSWVNIGFGELLRLAGYSGDAVYFPDLSGGGVVLALFVMALIPALFEETLFRGVILQSIKGHVGEVNAVLLCGLCFALFHASALQTFYQFLCGCAFALLAIRARSVLPCMIAHFLNNGALIVMQACGADTDGTLFDIAPLWAAVLVTVLSAVSLAMAAVLLFRGGERRDKPVKGAVKNFFIAASAGILICSLLWITGLFF